MTDETCTLCSDPIAFMPHYCSFCAKGTVYCRMCFECHFWPYHLEEFPRGTPLKLVPREEDAPRQVGNQGLDSQEHQDRDEGGKTSETGSGHSHVGKEKSDKWWKGPAVAPVLKPIEKVEEGYTCDCGAKNCDDSLFAEWD